MKTIVINADPKIKQEIGKLLKSAAEGAESVGSEVEYFDLYKIDMRGCMICSICKKKNKESFKCYWKDDLSPIIEKILNADTLLIGSQIFFNEPTSHYRALVERKSTEDLFKMLNGEVKVYESYKGMTSKKKTEEEIKAKEEEFEMDLKNAFEIGAELSKKQIKIKLWIINEKYKIN